MGGQSKRAILTVTVMNAGAILQPNFNIQLMVMLNLTGLTHSKNALSRI